MSKLEYGLVRPTPQLAPYIRIFHTVSSNGRKVAGMVGVHNPDGGLQLTLNLGAQLIIGTHLIPPLSAVISSPTVRYDTVHALGSVDLLNVGFHPAGARLFLHCPLDKLRHGSHPMDDFWPRWTVEALVDLALLPPVQRIAKLEALLLTQMKPRFAPSDRVQHATEAAQQMGGRLTVQQLADTVNLSRSQLFRRFKSEVGTSPKEYLRVHRVRNVMAQLQRSADKRAMAALAQDVGYFDQAHLIREFTQSTGLSPRKFLQREQDATFVQFVTNQNN